MQLGAALLDPFQDPVSRTWWVGLLTAVIVTAVFALFTGTRWSLASMKRVATHKSTLLDVQLYLGRQLIRLLMGTPAIGMGWLLATHGVRWMDAKVGVPTVPELSHVTITLLYTMVLFVAWDLSRFVLHLLMHRIPALWAFHQVHHSAEVLTPLTFHRIHPVESWLYDVRGTLVTGTIAGAFYWLFRDQAVSWTLLGVPALGLLFNLTTGNLRHSHVWLRFPHRVEGWLLSPAQHQIHHSADPKHYDSNYGTWLAIWDRAYGSLKRETTAPTTWGIPDGERNHNHDLLSAWFGPFKALVPKSAAAAMLLLLPMSSQAEETTPTTPSNETPASEEDAATEDEQEDSETPTTGPGVTFGKEIIVYETDGTPRVAGSAHRVDEAQLEAFEYNDIERVLAGVPGVTTRGEDGFGLRPNIGIRGVNNDRSAKVTLMEDGVLFAPAPYAAPAAYYFPMVTRMVGVEVFKGPAATRFGPQTVGGAVNLLTRDIPNGNAFSGDASLGLRNSVKTHFWASAAGQNTGLLFEAVDLRTDGFKELENGANTGFEHSELMAKAFWQPVATNRVELKLGYTREDSRETYLGLTYADWEENPYRRYAASALGHMIWDRTQAELAWDATLGSEWNIRTVAYHHWMSRAWTKFNRFAAGIDTHTLLQQAPDSGTAALYLAILKGEEDSSTADEALMIGTNDRRFQSYGIQTDAQWEVETDAFSSTLQFGVRLHGDDVNRLHTEDAYNMVGGELVATGEETLTNTDSLATARALAAHIHEELQIGRLHLLPALRVEMIESALENVGIDPEPSVTRTQLLPGFGTMYSLGDWTDLFAGSYRGFSPVAPGQPEDVGPELSWNHELGMRWFVGDRHVEFVGFFNDYENITGACTMAGGCTGDAVDRQYNGGAAWIYGVETVLGDTVLLPGQARLEFELTYAFTQTEFRTTFNSSFPQFGNVIMGDRLPYVPEHQGGATLALVSPDWAVNFGAMARSGMLDAAGTFPVTTADIPPLFLLDAGGHLRIKGRIKLYAAATNLTGATGITSWRPMGARPTPPFQIFAGVKLDAPE